MTPFARRVYRVVSGIPLGEVRSYKWVAIKAGSPQASRAVGQVLKNNPYPILIPCHRVVRSALNPGGYALGAKKKKALLVLERKIALCLAQRK
jgi:O-6-methylguanine DNA methyltransferase